MSGGASCLAWIRSLSRGAGTGRFSTDEGGAINRKTVLGIVGLVAALAFIAFRTQRNARRTIEQERGYISILERTANGYPECYTNVIPLVAGFTKPGERINWYASVFADPSKPEFSLIFSNVAEPRDEWEAAAKNPIARSPTGGAT